MKIRYGDYRYVLVFQNFVVKFPRIYLLNAIKNVWIQIKRRQLRWYLKKFKYGSSFSVLRMLFKGILDNWQECLFYKKTHYGFLMPTYYSFFGLVNIQARGQSWDQEDLHYRNLLSEITNDDVYDDAHGFLHANNYGFHFGRLKMFDYGGRRVIKVITKYGKVLERKFIIRDYS
jgi:hypothetical protein